MSIFCRKPSKETLTKLHERKFILHSQALNNLRKEISLIDDRNKVFNHFLTKMTSFRLKEIKKLNKGLNSTLDPGASNYGTIRPII